MRNRRQIILKPHLFRAQLRRWGFRTMVQGKHMVEPNFCTREYYEYIWCSTRVKSNWFALIRYTQFFCFWFRFGHNFGLQIKQALLDRNRTSADSPPLTKVVYRDCHDYPFRFVWCIFFDVIKTFDELREKSKQYRVRLFYLSANVKFVVQNFALHMNNVVLE